MSNLNIRKAVPGDYNNIKSLLASLKLPIGGIEDHLENFVVLECNREIIGTVGLEIYGPNALLRSMGIYETHQGKGLGSQLLDSIINQALNMNVKEVYLLTETAESFFGSHGFISMSRDDVHVDIQNTPEFKEICPNSAVCMKKTIQ